MPKKSKSPAAKGSSRSAMPEERGEVVEINLSDIAVDQTYQIRESGLNESIVEEYREIYARSPNSMEPIVCVRIIGSLVLVAGFQRHEAARRAGCETIRSRVIEGDEKTAMREALGSNKHGLRLSGGDKKKAILLALKHLDEYSNGKIADLIGCSESYVRKVREADGESVNDTSLGKDGKQYPARKRKKPKETPSSTPPAVEEPVEQVEDDLDVEEEETSENGIFVEETFDDDDERVESLFSQVMKTARNFTDDEKEQLCNKMYDFLVEEGYFDGGDDNDTEETESDDWEDEDRTDDEGDEEDDEFDDDPDDDPDDWDDDDDDDFDDSDLSVDVNDDVDDYDD